MPAFRPRNTRLGDVAEELGVLLLQGVCLVAPVPRSEDAGIDVIATLLRKFDSRRLIAEDSFYVQLKKKSVATVDFVGDEVKWLFSLELPFFFGKVDLETAAIELYSCQKLHAAYVLKQTWDRVTIDFSEKSQTEAELCEGTICIGPAIHHWKLADLESAECMSTFHNVVKLHIETNRLNVVSRMVGHAELLKWKMGQQPEWAGSITARPAKTSFEDIDDYVAPLMSAWVDQCMKDLRLDALDDWLRIISNAHKIVRVLRAVPDNGQQSPSGGTPGPMPAQETESR
jgi:hypothetical protein